MGCGLVGGGWLKVAGDIWLVDFPFECSLVGVWVPFGMRFVYIVLYGVVCVAWLWLVGVVDGGLVGGGWLKVAV